ncbi:M60 family metallopeptidase [Erwinia mallotivora]|uniref:M60 family metallopeptidase n=1 Tax=Erwinia mallotivora TaxID=69222 RepID=UPI0021C133B0|nr:M60 family metallopeptidase [Erwinia mallotivora]
MSDKIFTIYGFGNVASYTAKDKRTRQRSAHQLTPYYILQGQTVRITLSGEDHGLVEAATGLPGMDSRQHYTLNRGVNTFQSRGNGILSFLNKNDYGQVTVEINSSPQRIPYFKLHHSTENSWKQEINTNLSAPVALLSSELADVVVSTKSARDNVVSASELMRDFDSFLKVQDDTLGVSKNGKADFRIDPNRNLHVEASSGYMFAANEYTGYVGTAAMQRLLRTNNRWGIWHENGHQRQQHAWQWNGGTGMTEVTVNIFSLMSQEKMVGQVTALTNYYPAIREFLSQEKKDFDAAPVDMKLGLFWQLRLAFGEGFYPQLHQRYRLMSSTPATSAAAQQKSLLIRTVSEVVNINMIPFFVKWGIEHDNATSKYLEHYPALEKPLWENTDQHYYTLDMPEKKYIPELIHLRKNITNIVLNSNEARFTLDDEWCMPFHYVIKKNGIFLAKIEAGKAYYCSLQIVRNKCNVSFIFNSNDRLKDNDIFEIEAHLNGEKHSLLQTSVNMMNLQSEIDALFSNADQTELHLNVTQEYLDALWHQTEKLSARYDVVIMLIKAQQILLERTLSDAAFANSFYEVVFSSSDFKKYTYQVITGNHVIAEIVNGVPGMSSSLTNRTWKFSSNSISLNELNIQVSLHGYISH